MSPGPLEEYEDAAVALASKNASIEEWERLDERLSKHGALTDSPPALSRSGFASSRLELRLLLSAMGGVRVMADRPASGSLRGAYSISGVPGAKLAHAFPEFAHAIATRASVAEVIPTAEYIDARAYKLAIAGEWRAAAAAWLSSPGRRCTVAVDVPAVLAQFRADDILAAAGATARASQTSPPVDSLVRRVRRATVAGPAALKAIGRSRSVFELTSLVREILAFAESSQTYEVGAQHRSTRSDAELELAVALQKQPYHELECAALAHVGHAPHEAVSVLGAWHMAQWIVDCAYLSPTCGGDEVGLSKRFLAQLPVSERGAGQPDCMAPSRFATGGLDLLATVSLGTFLQYFWSPGERWFPAAMLDQIRAIAARPSAPSEIAAELALENGSDELGWRVDHPHLAPPFMARVLLTRLGFDWLTELSPDALHECLAALERDPTHHRWMAVACLREGASLGLEARRSCAASWRRIQTLLPPHLSAGMAAGLASVLTSEDIDQAISIALQQQDIAWGPLLALAREAEPQSGLQARALDALAGLFEDEQLSTKARLDAAVSYVRATAPGLEAEAHQRRLARIQTSMPFANHVGLQRAIRRLRSTG